jgi:ribonuclease BN (tRNA processing enzyme)
LDADALSAALTDKKDKRLRASAYIEYKGFKILIDCGPDFRQQVLHAGISEIDAILLTHQHKDHTGGLDDVRAFNFLQRSAFPVYCEPRVLESLKKEYSYAAFTVKAINGKQHSETLSQGALYPGAPEYEIHLIEDEPFKITKVIKQRSSGRQVKKSITITPLEQYITNFLYLDLELEIAAISRMPILSRRKNLQR